MPSSVNTEEQLRLLHKKGKGILNKLYFSNTGKVFKGDNKGRLVDISDTYSVEGNLQVIQDELQIITLSKNKKFIFNDNGDLTNKIVYTDSTLTKKQYEVEYVYSGSDLIRIDVTRNSDNFTFSKNLEYDTNGNLKTITLI